MTWRRVEMDEALRWFAQKYLAGARPVGWCYAGDPPPEANDGVTVVALKDGSAVAAASEWSSSGFCDEPPSIDAEAPQFWIGEP